MRAVLDSNVLVSALLWHGTPHTILERAYRGRLTLVSSPALLAELAHVLARPKFHSILGRSGISAEQLSSDLEQLIEATNPPPLPRPVARDPDDDAILAVAAFARVDLIVSGDKDLLAIGRYLNIPILPPAQALQLIDGDK